MRGCQNHFRRLRAGIVGACAVLAGCGGDLGPPARLDAEPAAYEERLGWATDQNIALITHVEGNVDTDAAEITNPLPTADFGSLLEAFRLHLPDGSSK